MNRLEIIKTFESVLNGAQEVVIKVPRTFKFFGKKLFFGTKSTFKIINFKFDPILNSGYGFTKVSTLGTSYGAIFNGMGTLEDVVIFGFIQHRISREYIDEDLYDFVMSHIQELKDYWMYESSIKKLEL